MEHRKQMQQEAEQWQKTSVKLIRGIRYGVLIFGILVVAVMFLVNLGFPREVNTTFHAMVMTAEGETLEATVELKGQVTKYPLNRGKASVEDNVTVYINGNRMMLVSLHGERQSGFICAQNDKAVCLLSVNLDKLLLETDLKYIFPDMDSQQCLVYTNFDTVDLPGEYAGMFTVFEK